MAIIDPTTTVGKLRLRVGDTSDLPILSDSVYEQTYIDSGNSLNRASATCAQYILALLSQNTHSKLVQIEVWGGEAFTNYLAFLTKVVLNPNLSQTCPIPYSASNDKVHPLIEFTDDWYGNFHAGTQSEELAQDSVSSGYKV
jgi:hypothetical protein